MKEELRALIEMQAKEALSIAAGRDGVIVGKRLIKQGKQGSRSSLFYSAKSAAFIPVESRLERLYCYQLEKDREICRYVTQALEIPYRATYLYPDFLVHRENGDISVVEIKHSRFAETEASQAKMSYLKAFFSGIGIPFLIFTEKDLQLSTRRRNEISLYDRGGRSEVLVRQLHLVSALLKSLGPLDLNVAMVREKLQDSGLSPCLLETALFHGALKCDMNSPITSSSKLEVSL